MDSTELARYIEAMTALHAALVAGEAPPSGEDVDDGWVSPWLGEAPERLREYIDFVDPRRWRAVSCGTGEIVDSIASPPRLDLADGRFTFRG